MLSPMSRRDSTNAVSLREVERLKKVHLEAEQFEKELEAEELEKETQEAEQRMSRYRPSGGTPPRIETFLPIT